jgi:hypothetical protein
MGAASMLRVRGCDPTGEDLHTGVSLCWPCHPQRAITKRSATQQGGDAKQRATRPGRSNPVQSPTYEITFLGQAGTTLRAEFEDCELTIGPGTTTLRAELPDSGALSGLMERINSLALDVIDVSLVAEPER